MDRLESLLTQVLGEVRDLRHDLGLGGQGGGPHPLDPSPPRHPATPPQEASEEREKGNELTVTTDETRDAGVELTDQDDQNIDQGDDRADDDGVQLTRSVPSSPHHDALPTLPERGSPKGFFLAGEAEEVLLEEMEVERESCERARRRTPRKVQPLINVTLGPMAECDTSGILECSMCDRQFTLKAAFEAHHKGHRFEG